MSYLWVVFIHFSFALQHLLIMYFYLHYLSLYRNNRKKKRGNPYTSKKQEVSIFTKDCVCLKFQDQTTWIPQVQERIELAKLGLGRKKLTFNADGDAQHVHDIIISNFPVLDSYGGYTLLRLKENSRKLVAIDSPDCSITVPFLTDILRQAKLYICPLQLTKEAETFCSSDQSVSCYAIILR